MNPKAKKTVKIVVDVILWVFLIFALLMTVLAFSANANTEAKIPKLGNTCFLTVLTDSMTGDDGFNPGDLIFCTWLDEAERGKLELGQVVTFLMDNPDASSKNKEVYNSHRIVDINRDADGNVLSYVTKGDHNPTRDDNAVSVADVRAVWSGKKVAGFGKVINFLQGSTGFLVCIVLPLLVFFLYELVVLVSTVASMKSKNKTQISAEDEELIKQRAVEEYIKQQAEKQAEEDKED